MYRGTRGKGRLVKTIKRTILKMAEPKDVPSSWDKEELYHNSGSAGGTQVLPTVWALKDYFTLPLQGNTDHQRNGDHIFMNGISVKLLLGQKEDRMNVTFRIVVIECTTDQEPSAYGGTGGLFENTSGNVLLDSVNTDRGRIVYQKFIKKNISPQLSTYHSVLNPLDPAFGAPEVLQRKELTHTHKFWIPHRRMIKFTDQAANNQYSGTRLYMYVFAYDAYGTLKSDNVAYVQGWSKLYFRDP